METDRMKDTFEELVKLLEELRGPEGCPWDKEQTLQTMKKDILEEAEEVAEAIDEGDIDHIKEELGDLLWATLLALQITKEEGHFDVKEVMKEVNLKIKRRHPHVFGEMKGKLKTAEEVLEHWDEIKKKEKEEKAKDKQKK